MTLTAAEKTRIANIEEKVSGVSNLIEGASSKNMLNRLLMLAQERIDRLETRLATANTKLEELIQLAEKLQ